ncbi:MAG: LCP family protein [Anaerolineales bacterium]|jgi:LCP family protein required for cell wall assembly|uniref:LCP family protein n=1 Tax=Candidatus Villigracilis vicinus TaxID=3140679 RepID=UPI003136ABF6|nr:LCP family protein [Anaerolineales bacterium]MBK9778536.1 LCP family protein [Anaerolineales bacterium]
MDRFEFLKNIKIGRPTIPQIIFWGVTVALAVAVYILLGNFVQCWTFTELPGIPPAQCGVTTSGDNFEVNADGTQQTAELPAAPEAAVPVDVLPPTWDGASRINILFIGLDSRDLEANQGPPRTDTMLLFTVDPVSKTAGMLSIPRDMWVNIPGFGYSRINTAYPSGEGAKLPGGGPALAMKTVSQFLGVPVHYYVQVDFNVFIRMVDELINIGGCIHVEPSEKMILDPIGPGMDKVVFTPGGDRPLCQGWKVLAYARNRHTSGGDTDRARRQQEVVLALADIIFDTNNFPQFISNAPRLYNELSYGIKTDMAFDDAVKLAMLGREVSLESIRTGVIDPQQGMAIFDNTVLNGEAASILKPVMDKIRVLRDEIFTSTGPTSPVAVPIGYTDVNLFAQAMQQEEARVRIMDGTFTPGLDQRAGAVFQSYGMTVTEVAPSPEVYSQTVIVVYGPKLYTIKWMQAAFGISDRQIRFSPDPNQNVDIEIRLGSDIAGSIP